MAKNAQESGHGMISKPTNYGEQIEMEVSLKETKRIRKDSSGTKQTPQDGGSSHQRMDVGVGTDWSNSSAWISPCDTGMSNGAMVIVSYCLARASRLIQHTQETSWNPYFRKESLRKEP